MIDKQRSTRYTPGPVVPPFDSAAVCRPGGQHRGSGADRSHHRLAGPDHRRLHRLRACGEAGVEPRYEFLDDDADPVQWVIAKNGLRRDMDDNQRAVIAHHLSQWSTPRAAAAGPG